MKLVRPRKRQQNRQDAANIKYSNGELPHIKNPAMIPGCCKHVAALLNMVATRGW